MFVISFMVNGVMMMNFVFFVWKLFMVNVNVYS